MPITNPVLAGFHPDPSILRAEGRYVLATSTFEWFPGVRFHESDDLVTWRPAGHALTTREQLDLRGVPDSGGIWAPSLSHAQGQYWLVYTVVRTMAGQTKDLDNYLVVAPSLEGPWSEPVYLQSRGFDPSLFHAPDGRRYLVSLRWDHRTGHDRFGGIHLQELDPRTHAPLGRPRVVYTPEAHVESLCEGPNLYARDGWYHLMLAEGGTGWNHGIRMARSRDLWGPYAADPEPLLTTRDLEPAPGRLHKAGHGELVETPDGEWFLAHLASRPVATPAGPMSILGRETCLQRVTWTGDDHLVLAHGGHHPAETVDAPRAARASGVAPSGVSPVPAPLRDAEPGRDAEPAGDAQPEGDALGRFTPDGLEPGWVSLRVPIDASWADLAARPGWLRLRGRDSLHSLFDQSLVARRLTAVRSTVTVTVEADPVEETERAGLVAYYDTTSHAFLHVTADPERGRVLALAVSDVDGAHDEVLLDLPAEEWPQVHLRLEVDEAVLRFAVSGDRAHWRTVGPELDAGSLSDDHRGLLRFTGAFVGLCAQDLGTRSWTADFTGVEVVDHR